MSLVQTTSTPFAHRRVLVVPTGNQTTYYEFDKTVFLHGLSVQSSTDVTAEVELVFPTTFASSGESSNAVKIANGNVGTSGLFMAPGSVTPGGVANSPLPAVLPKGSVLRVKIDWQSGTPTAEIFLIASSAD